MEQTSGEELSWRETAHAKALGWPRARALLKGKGVSVDQVGQGRSRGQGQSLRSATNCPQFGFHSEWEGKPLQQGSPGPDLSLLGTTWAVENGF